MEIVGGWKTLNSRIAYQSRWLNVREDKIIRPDGSEGMYSVCKRGRSNQIVAVAPDGRVCVVGQFRYPIQRYSWELPGGGNKEGEGVVSTAIRELREETGFRADDWQEIGQFALLNSLCEDFVDVLAATRVHRIGGEDQQEEGIDNMKFVSATELADMIQSGEINNPPSISAIFLAVLKGFIKLPA